MKNPEDVLRDSVGYVRREVPVTVHVIWGVDQ